MEVTSNQIDEINTKYILPPDEVKGREVDCKGGPIIYTRDDNFKRIDQSKPYIFRSPKFEKQNLYDKALR